MNTYFLFLGCVFLVIACWLLFKDIFSPATIICEVFAISSFFSIISAKNRQTDISLKTVVFIMIVLLAGVVVAAIFKPKQRRTPVIEQEPTPIVIDKKRYNLLLSAIAVMTGVYSVFYLKAILSYPGEAFAQMLAAFRQASVTEGISGIPMVVQYLSKAIYAFAYFSAYIFVHNLLVSKKTGIKEGIFPKYLIGFALLAITAVLTGARAELIYFIVFIFTVQAIIQNKMYPRRFSFKSIMKIALLGVAALFAFYVTSYLIGRPESSFINAIAGYFGSPIVAFDRYLEDTASSSPVWGKETFYSLVHLLQKIGILKHDVGSIHLEYVYINEEIFTNVYTAFRFYISDFGVLGAIPVHCVCVLFYESVYHKCNCEAQQLGYVNMKILIYGLISYGVFLYFYSNYFFALILSLHTFLQIVCIYVFAEFTKFSRREVRK